MYQAKMTKNSVVTEQSKICTEDRETGRKGGQKILIIDDSEMNRAHDDDAGWIFPGVYPNSGMPGTSPGAYPGIIPPFYFPGAGGTPDL